MKTEIKIIKAFLEDKNSKTIREIAKQIKSDYKITYIAIQRLTNKNIIGIKTIGKSSLCTLNENYFGIELIEAENERKEDILNNKNLKQLYNEILTKIKISSFIFLLFGSYAKRKQTKSSDIDIIIIINEKNFENKLSEIVSLIPLKIHSLVFTEEEFITMKDSKKSNVIQEAIKNNIILYGIEAYYKLKNA